MPLPPLPKQNKNREASFSLKFREWLMKNPRISCSFEMKDTRGKNSLKFSEVTDVQRNYGMSIKSNRGTLIRVQGLSGEPDYVYFRNTPAYLVINYPQGWVIMDIETFIMEDERSKIRSLSWSRAKELSTVVVA
jgi:hypothetical protein